MDRALLFLWSTLLKRRALRFVVELRRPAKLLGFLTPLSLLGFLYYYHDHEFFGQLLKREAIVGCVLLLAAAFTVVFTLPLLLLLKYNNEMVGKNMGGDSDEILKFHAGVAIFLGFLAFLLQRSFPFDFRTDGPHLVGFRTLPMSPLAIVFAEIAVPTLLCLAFQAAGILALIYFGRFNWITVLMIALLYDPGLGGHHHRTSGLGDRATCGQTGALLVRGRI